MQNRARRFLLHTLALSALLAVGLNFGYLEVIEARARRGIWYEEKVAKGLLLSSLPEAPDLVFVGSSRTQNHVDTEYLTRTYRSSFNYGLIGRQLAEMPYVVRRSAHQASRAVIISLPGSDLFFEPTAPDEFTLYDLRFWALTMGRLRYLTGLSGQQLRSLIPYNRMQTFIREHRGVDADLVKMIAQRYGYDLRKDPRPLNYIRGEGNRYVAVFGNGDALVFCNRLGTEPPPARTHDKREEPFHPATIALMRALAELVLEQGKLVVFVLEPERYDAIPLVDSERLREQLGPEVTLIDNTTFSPGIEFWADEVHLNRRGVELYSALLLGQLKEAGL